jgi:hypothetical protein
MAASASQIRETLSSIADAGTARLAAVLTALDGDPTSMRSDLLDLAPSLIAAYTDGTSALAADWYDDIREEASPPRLYLAEPVVVDRGEKIGRMVAWASEPLFAPEPDVQKVALRLLPSVQKEIARPFRDTITTNTQRDPSAHGWRRIASGSGCKFCRMLSDRGAVYSGKGARFAAHSNCHCSAEPAFQPGPAASDFQYVASQRRRSEKDRAHLRDYLNANY